MQNRIDREEFAPASADEVAALLSNWESGQLHRHVERVLTFVERNRSDILRIAGYTADAEALVSTAKRVIVQSGTVHSPSEMRDQIHEIQDEIWIRGERGDYGRENIAHEWTSQHAANWRRWRLTEYLFVADRLAQEIVARLGA